MRKLSKRKKVVGLNKVNKKTQETLHFAGCMICGKDLVYSETSVPCTCELCGRIVDSNAYCQDGHFICDTCHSDSKNEIELLLRVTKEKDPIKILNQIYKLDSVHMHGPEHHSIVPGTMLVAFKNNGGEIDLQEALEKAFQRGSQVPGGVCGFWGSCGAAIGTGIFASIALGSNPVHPEVWGMPQQLTSRTLDAISAFSGPRCCKRNSRLAIETAVQWTKEMFGIDIPMSDVPCFFSMKNRECLFDECPFYEK